MWFSKHRVKEVGQTRGNTILKVREKSACIAHGQADGCTHWQGPGAITLSWHILTLSRRIQTEAQQRTRVQRRDHAAQQRVEGGGVGG